MNGLEKHDIKIEGTHMKHFKTMMAGCAFAACATFGGDAVLAQTPTQAAPETQLNWQTAPAVGKVAGKAEIKLTGDQVFLDSRETDKFMQLTGNLPMSDGHTLAVKSADWFAILSYVDEGYVKDDEKIDAADLLKSLKENNVEGNKERAKRGLPAVVLEDWFFPPRYDTDTRRLEWGTKLRSTDNSVAVNVTTKILGRSGYTSAILVTGPETMDKDLLAFKQALKSFGYVPGEKYSEWKSGDRVAAYGLGALVLGGAAAVATKKGGLKMILLAIAAGGAALWAGVKKLLGRNKAE